MTTASPVARTSGAGRAPRLPDLDSLALFLAVDSTGSVGGAARQVGISQSAASQRLRTLENDLGVTLLERRHTGATLTIAGLTIAEWAAPLVRQGADFSRTVAALAADRGAPLRLAASLTVADYLVPAWLIALHEVLPEVAVSLLPMNSEQVAQAVERGEVDLGFVEGPVAPRGLRNRSIGHDELVVVVAPGHVWASRRRPLTPADLVLRPLVLREPASGTRQVLDRALAQHGLAARPTLELGSTTAIKQSLRDGTSATVLSRLSVADELAAGKLVACATEELDFSRVFRAVWRSGPAPAGPAGALLALVERSA